MTPTARQSSFVAVWLVILVGAIVVAALIAYPAEGFLRVWAVIGVLVGVLVGAVPGYFFAAAAGRADGERGRYEEKLQTLLAISDPSLVREAARLRPELCGELVGEPPSMAAESTGESPGPGLRAPSGDDAADPVSG